MSRCPPLQQLSAYLEGMLPEGELPTVEAHVRTCLVCDGLLSDLKLQAQSAANPAEVSGRDGSQRAANAAGVATAGAPPTQLGPYLLLKKLGQGGMGAVYKARHTKLDRIEAVKILPRDLMRDPQAVERFEREMRAVAKLDHPHIVRAHHAGEEHGQHYLVMEHVDGCDVSSILKQFGRLRIPDACEIARQAAEGLQHAHEHGLVHRDIKPSNLIVSGRGIVKVLDLGLALVGSETGVPIDDLTSTGQIMGTLDYMAPEQGGNSHQVDIRADLYSLGATLYCLLAGRPPFGDPQHANRMKKLSALANEAPSPIVELRPDVPAELAMLVHRLLAKDPRDRFATPAEVVEQLRVFTDRHDLRMLVKVPASGLAEGAVIPGDSTVDFSALPLGSTHRTVDWLGQNPELRVDVAVRDCQIARAARRPSLRIGIRTLFVLAALVAFAMLGIVIRVSTDRGDLVITSTDPGVRVAIKKSGRMVHEWELEQGNNKFMVWSGDYEIELAGQFDGLTVKDGEFTLTRGDTRRVRIERIPKSVAARTNSVEQLLDPKTPEKTSFPPMPREMQSLQAKSALSNRYRLTVIEPLPDYPVWCQPVDIAENGDILGICSSFKAGCVFVRSNGVMRELDLPQDRYAYPKRITSTGQVFGTLTTRTKPYHSMPFVVESGQLRMLEQELNTRLNGANNAGVGVGIRGPTETSGEVAVLLQDGKVMDLRLPQGTSESRATAINNRGQTAIDFFAVRNGKKAWWSGRVDGQQIVEFGAFKGITETNAVDINEAGDVIGIAKGGDDNDRERVQPFLYHDGKLVAIPVLSGFNQASPFRINSKGQVVGYAFQRDGGQHAFLYQQGRSYDVNPDGWMYSKATAINAAGQIVGEGKLAGEDKTIGFLLDPIAAKTSSSNADQSFAALPERTISPSTGMQFVLIPPGTFRMGSTKSDALRYAAKSRFDDTIAEQPQHNIHISKPFYLGIYEVTQDEYQQVMGVNPSHFSKSPDNMDNVEGQETDRFPVETVSWFDAVEYCNKLSRRDNLPEAYQLKVVERQRGTIVEADVKLTQADGYRLPTEAEWEYACRANTIGTFHFGETLTGDQANVDGTHPFGTNVEGPSLQRPTVVGCYKPNAFGLHDMHGNVSEWCQDMADIATYSTRDKLTADPLVSSSTNSTARIERGGAWTSWPISGRSADRHWQAPSHKNRSIGFRIARGRIGSVSPVPPTPHQSQSTANQKQTASGFAGAQAGEERDDNKLQMKFCWCPDGHFQMGSPTNEAERVPNEDQIDVQLTGFWMGKHEVTQAEWQTVMESMPSELPGERMPVNNVSWDDANAFVEKLTVAERSAGRLPNDWLYRLPSEAQWEYACRAGTTSPFAYGKTLSMEQANFRGQKTANGELTGLNRPADVGSYQPNRWGLCDMHGNVAEWCRNAWEPSLANGLGSEALLGVHERTRRGGAFNQLRSGLRSAYRDSAPHETRRAFIGFRVVLERAAKPVAALSTNSKGAAPSVPSKPSSISTTPPARVKSAETRMELVLIMNGVFQMGSPAGGNQPALTPQSTASIRFEIPQHAVRISKPFYMGIHEVTQDQFQHVMHFNPSQFSATGANKADVANINTDGFPVERVSWFDAVEFCNKLSDLDHLSAAYQLTKIERAGQSIRNAEVSLTGGGGYRLPTEAEWEYACRAGTTTVFHYGDSLNGDQANVNSAAQFGPGRNAPVLKRPTTVGTYQPNAFGLFDMHGNVFEWCQDVADTTVYSKRGNLTIDPLVTTGDTTARIERGGDFGGMVDASRSAGRQWEAPGNRFPTIGFRVVRPLADN